MAAQLDGSPGSRHRRLQGRRGHRGRGAAPASPSRSTQPSLRSRPRRPRWTCLRPRPAWCVEVEVQRGGPCVAGRPDRRGGGRRGGVGAQSRLDKSRPRRAPRPAEAPRSVTAARQWLAAAHGSLPADHESPSHAHAARRSVKLRARAGRGPGRVAGTGAKGRITEQDVKAHVKRLLATPASAPASALPRVPEVDFAAFGPVERQAAVADPEDRRAAPARELGQHPACHAVRRGRHHRDGGDPRTH